MTDLKILCPTCQDFTIHYRGTEIHEDKRQDGNGYHYWVKVHCQKCDKLRWHDFSKGGKRENESTL